MSACPDCNGFGQRIDARGQGVGCQSCSGSGVEGGRMWVWHSHCKGQGCAGCEFLGGWYEPWPAKVAE